MGRELLALIKPPKPLSEMTDDELKAFADSIFDSIAPPADEDTQKMES